MSRNIAFFDFDGTLTTKDSMLELIRFHAGHTRFNIGFLLLSPYMVMMKAGIISNQAAKEKMLAHFFAGMEIDEFNRICRAFASSQIPSLIRPGVVDYIRKLQADDTQVVVVSASAENWLSGWCDGLGIQLLASVLEVRDGKLTGKLVGLNCHGDEKVARIKKTFDLSRFARISCFGDTSGDKPMLALGNDPHYKPFRENWQTT